MKEFEERIIQRIKNVDGLVDLIRSTEDRVYVAGGAFLKEYNDIDIYPVREDQFKGLRTIECGFETIAVTPNAITLKSKNDKIVQFCDYWKPTLIDLISSFDFAHCQIGAVIKHEEVYNITAIVSYTNSFAESMMLQETSYTGSEYPLSSLMRAEKYKERGFLSPKQYRLTIIKILTDIVRRGFTDEEDFKYQLNAIDITIPPEEWEGMTSELLHLYELLAK